MQFLSSKTHTIIGIVVALLLLAAPNLLGFSANEAATLVARLVGVFVLINELITTSAYSPLKLISMKAHIALDVVTGVFLAVSPWLFGFADSAANVWVPHLIVGLVIVGYALVTDPALDSVEPIH